MGHSTAKQPDQRSSTEPADARHCDSMWADEDLLSHVLDLPVVAAIAPGDGCLFKLTVDVSMEYRPLSTEERRALLARIQGVEAIFRR